MGSNKDNLLGSLRRSMVPLDRIARVVTGLGGGFLILRAFVGSLQVCSAGASCPPDVTAEAVATVLFGVVLVYVAVRFDPD